MFFYLPKKCKQRLLIVVVVAVVLLIPFIVDAQDPLEPTPELKAFVNRSGALIAGFTAIVSAIAFLGFVVGLMRFIFHAGEEEKRKDGKKMMVWSIGAIFVMVSIWGIVELLQSAFTIDELSKEQKPPCLDSEFFGSQLGC